MPMSMPSDWSTDHEITPNDMQAMVGLRAVVAPNKGKLRGIAARAPFDAIMSRVIAPEEVTFEPEAVGGVSGWWCRPANAEKGGALIHFHDGWFNWGTARAFQNLVGHIAKQSAVNAFIPDYRLAPEHPFPAAVEDAQACYAALVDRGVERIALSGDSAGGNLALLLVSSSTQKYTGSVSVPIAAVAISPVTDLSLSGSSWEARALADPYFIRTQAAELVRAYLNGENPSSPSASPLFANLAGLPPIRVHVGDDEVLLEDSRRYVERAVAAGVDARLETWMGMPHGFLGAIGKMDAAQAALSAIGKFLSERLASR